MIYFNHEFLFFSFVAWDAANERLKVPNSVNVSVFSELYHWLSFLKVKFSLLRPNHLIFTEDERTIT